MAVTYHILSMFNYLKIRILVFSFVFYLGISRLSPHGSGQVAPPCVYCSPEQINSSRYSSARFNQFIPVHVNGGLNCVLFLGFHVETLTKLFAKSSEVS